ncbi:MAG: hypothetical protein R3F55_06370 [Alphaproteobacteria bacterium]
MDKDFVIFLLVGVCIVNGIFSPAVFYVWGYALAWYPGFLPFTPELSFYLTSLITATLTLMLSGVVAALFERLTRRATTDKTSLWVWFAAAAALSIPALDNAVG